MQANVGPPEPIQLVGIIDRPDARYEALRNLVPILNRQPPSDWAITFERFCRHHRTLVWARGGYALCRPTERASTSEVLGQLVTQANTLIGLDDAQPHEGTVERIEVLGGSHEPDGVAGFVYDTQRLRQASDLADDT